ncbi:tRNA pseudouridine(38-40) synthase TruA [Pedobacter sp. Leaf194]|uniref:tRNA pseudouridine(38-40) synthase TruA n=1 Tax=Pedobacter sp. Leaf194 TaxID=1736297 RepID=UPI0007030F4B|nr:tRNA pseudouridine(38-40) synthase TruA [Pedobacter sp. Leaf194]KQS41966.1 pseudouridine synthase [Pedobacter sp. Leaf194]RYD77991.1 MAG: tRNA pseudouridine(38-40) synthase TruA [Sphingobacteriales bacterium]
MTKKRYFIQIAYDGSLYHGWQTQPNAVTVQELLDKAMSVFFRQPVETLGCGRTDSGVHATEFFAHFDVENCAEEKVLVAVAGINAMLPYQIAVKRILPVHNDAHARFDATARAYKYYLHFDKDPFKINRSWLMKDRLDIGLMNKAAEELLNYTDFSCFSKSNTQTFTNNCKIMQAGFETQNEGLVFTIEADRFLRNMVRAIVGTLVRVGKGEIGIEDFKNIIDSKNRSNAGQSVPACGLYLVSVKYPYINVSIKA